MEDGGAAGTSDGVKENHDIRMDERNNEEDKK